MRAFAALAGAVVASIFFTGVASAASMKVKASVQGAGAIVDAPAAWSCGRLLPAGSNEITDCLTRTVQYSGSPQHMRLDIGGAYPGWAFVRWAGCDSVNGTVCTLDVPGAGPDRTVDPRAIYRDVAAPNVVALTVLPSGTSEGRYTATWGADELGVSFKCVIDNGSAASCESGYTFTLAEGSHSVRVYPVDRSRNVGTAAEVKLSVVDTVLDESPAEGAYVATYPFAAHTGTGMAMECALDGGAWFACGGASGPLTLPALADGQHTLKVRGVLNGTVDRYPAIRTWVVDTTAPDTMFTDFRITANEPVAGFRCRLDGVDTACSRTLPNTPGTHTFEVIAIDHAGNVDPTPARYTWTVEPLAAPTVYVPTRVEVPAAEKPTPLRLHYSYSRGRLTRLEASGPAGFKLTVKKPRKRATATTVAKLSGSKLPRGTKITVRAGAQARTVTLR
jgi:hypothetical protein